MSDKASGASVESTHYAGVSVEHPTIISTIKNMVKQGKKKEEIMRVVGMPGEVVERHSRDVR